jgi:hypothetical protein
MQATCEVCKTPFEAQRVTAKYCSKRCSVRATRSRAAGRPLAPAQQPTAAAPAAPTVQAPPVSSADTPLLVAATISELAAAEKLGTTLGQQAVRLAERMVAGSETGSAVASLSKELRATMAEALKGAQQAGDPVDEIRARRDRKRSAG